MALSCSHQASHLVEEDDRFVIYAPAIMNAEVVAYQGDIQQIKTLGVGQQRLSLKLLVIFCTEIDISFSSPLLFIRIHRQKLYLFPKLCVHSQILL